MLSVDEKPHIQALERAQGWLKLRNGKAITGFNHEYKRHGTTTLFAALEVATGLVKAGHYRHRRRVEFVDFMNRVVAACPGREVHVILGHCGVGCAAAEGLRTVRRLPVGQVIRRSWLVSYAAACRCAAHPPPPAKPCLSWKALSLSVGWPAASRLDLARRCVRGASHPTKSPTWKHPLVVRLIPSSGRPIRPMQCQSRVGSSLRFWLVGHSFRKRAKNAEGISVPPLS